MSFHFEENFKRMFCADCCFRRWKSQHVKIIQARRRHAEPLKPLRVGFLFFMALSILIHGHFNNDYNLLGSYVNHAFEVDMH